MKTAEQSYIGLMSGTSMDGIDAVWVKMDGMNWRGAHGHFFVPYDQDLRQRLLALQDVGDNELHRAMTLGRELAQLNAAAVNGLLHQYGLAAADIVAIGAHGQTVRHAPQAGYTCQLLDAALLTHLTGIDCISDFRSRDIAGGGQGAPLVPAFHQAVFGNNGHRIILNLGGIANISILSPDGRTRGWDTGPANMLADAFIQQRLGLPYDENGAVAASGGLLPNLLARLLAHPFFAQTAPKSTGREAFSLAWLQGHLKGDERVADVLHTLNVLTAQTVADAVRQADCGAREVFACGGGTLNPVLMAQIAAALGENYILQSSAVLQLPVQWVEAAAFAWLAAARVCRWPSNSPAATGAAGAYVLGAWHCA